MTVNTAVRDYNYDLWSGIEYKLDVTKPVGQRVVELKLNGQPLAMDQVVRVALNNYRATGKFPTAPKLYQSTTEVRELITNWIMERGTISPERCLRPELHAAAAGQHLAEHDPTPARHPLR